jgi:hypothetical protein
MIQFKSVDSDVFSSSQWQTLVTFTFNDGTNTIPLELPPLETDSNYSSTGLKVVGLMYCGITFALSIGFGCWTYCYRNNNKQLFLLYITISAGTFLMGEFE